MTNFEIGIIIGVVIAFVFVGYAVWWIFFREK